MVKDDRYVAVQSMFESGKIQKFSDIFKVLPKTILARDMGQNYRTFVAKIASPDRFTVGEIRKIARLIDVTYAQMFESIITDIEQKRI